ncbi:MAG: putative zinc metalloprotease [Microgenomates group bacterium ADurb.Bin219]|nr:MAG: putative zinc metalloprotease [Microgenomates group bacterium ADurb.Bin219]HNP89384.1 M50 family metallopeptidase [Candidatus Woesebacteria bacterium]
MTLLLFLLILSLLVFVHEFGHFIMAKKAGILVEEFGFGLPPRIWGKKVGETTYSINALPIGGFVKLYGEDGEKREEIKEIKKIKMKNEKIKIIGRAFYEKSIPRRISVILAGVTMNFLLAILVFSVVYYVSGIPTRTGNIKVVGLVEGSPAEIAGIEVDDEILALNEEKLNKVENFIDLTKSMAGRVISLEIKRAKAHPCQPDQPVFGGAVGPNFQANCRNGNLLLSLIPRENPPEGEGPLGVIISDVEMKRYSPWLMFYYGIREGLKESFSWGKTIFVSLAGMVSGLLKGQVPRDVAGPIGIYQATGMVAQSGFLAILQFLGILSINLAIINILPFPALDGGRLLFLGVEAFAGRKITPKIEAAVNSLGMVFLLLLALLITINDLARIFNANQILEKLFNISR